MRTNAPLEGIGALVEGKHENPFEILGPHEVSDGDRQVLAVRAYLPHSDQAWVVDSAHNVHRPMRRIHPAGVYEAICPERKGQPKHVSYQLRVAEQNGETTTMHDPYAFDSLISDYDLYLFGEGSHGRLYERLGAQLREVDGVAGTNFAVWAPNAAGVSVVGDFNDWDGRRHPLRKLIPSGIWEIFVPGMKAGQRYKFRIKTPAGEMIDKADPMGFATEVPPHTASIVTDINRYEWNDAEWLERREDYDPLVEPISVYEVHLGSWRQNSKNVHGWKNYRDLAVELVEYCLHMGYTHIELMPISEHPFTGSWGYQTVGHFAVTSRYGEPDDFKFMVDHCHQNGIGVILDWVPAHFPRDGHGLRRFDGTALYEHADPRQGEHPDWGTMIFNYDRHEVRNYLVANALFWLDKYHLDGLRVDAVASMLYLDYSRDDGEWIPNEFGGRENLGAIATIKQFNEQAHSQFPGVLTIAEESTAWPGVSQPTYCGGLGFSLKWNMGWMNDTLRFMGNDPIHRRYHHHELTFSLIYAFSENFSLPLSHDEVVHGKGALLSQMPGDWWQKFANLRLLYAYMWTHPGKKLLFMGCDLAMWNEWDCDREIEWGLLEFPTHRGIQQLVADLNRLYRDEPALHQLDSDGMGFEWIDCDNATDSVLCYLRKGRDPADHVVVCLNLTPVVRRDYLVGVPHHARYREVFNSDSEYYGGTNVGNGDGLQADVRGHHGKPHSVRLTLPPLAMIVLKPE